MREGPGVGEQHVVARVGVAQGRGNANPAVGVEIDHRVGAGADRPLGQVEQRFEPFRVLPRQLVGDQNAAGGGFIQRAQDEERPVRVEHEFNRREIDLRAFTEGDPARHDDLFNRRLGEFIAEGDFAENLRLVTRKAAVVAVDRVAEHRIRIPPRPLAKQFHFGDTGAQAPRRPRIKRQPVLCRGIKAPGEWLRFGVVSATCENQTVVTGRAGQRADLPRQRLVFAGECDEDSVTRPVALIDADPVGKISLRVPLPGRGSAKRIGARIQQRSRMQHQAADIPRGKRRFPGREFGAVREGARGQVGESTQTRHRRRARSEFARIQIDHQLHSRLGWRGRVGNCLEQFLNRCRRALAICGNSKDKQPQSE